jgi:hypothetical protein
MTKLSTIEKVIKGLEIVNKYPGAEVYAEHDQIYINHSYDVGLSKEHIETLIDKDWYLDDSSDNSWHTFV